ncbi:MAG: hypothetical protein OEY63_03060 [Gemmatimonadota bacterium]|nr:hypothetical protein [Gemmatimonadota bacterium]MDH5803614.1 hypothetical protein [Gemmatimonadota bacterium]
MKYHKLKFLSVLSLAAVVGCVDGADPLDTAEPVPGNLVLSLTSPYSDDGGVRIEIAGPILSKPFTAIKGAVLYSELAEDGSGATVALLAGELPAGALLEFAVPDVKQWESYQITLTEVVNQANEVRGDMSDYELQLGIPTDTQALPGLIVADGMTP